LLICQQHFYSTFFNVFIFSKKRFQRFLFLGSTFFTSMIHPTVHCVQDDKMSKWFSAKVLKAMTASKSDVASCKAHMKST